MSLDPAPPEPKKLSAWQIFLLFSSIAIVGFGGVLPWTYRALVERKKLLTNAEFREIFAFGQILPGPPICNVAVVVGYRLAGVAGGLAALAGFFTIPTILVILLGLGYQRFGDLRPVHNAIVGMSAVAAGLIVAIAVKMSVGLPRRWKNIIFVGLMFVAVALMRWPLLYALLVLAPLAMLVFRREINR